MRSPGQPDGMGREFLAELAFGLESFGVKSGEIQSRVGEMAAFFGIELMTRDIYTFRQSDSSSLCVPVMATDP